GRIDGAPGPPDQGSRAANRARARFEEVAFAGCVAGGLQGARGGALAADLADLTIDDSLVLDSEAVSGGGLALAQESAVTIAGTTFAGNMAENAGGALHARGIELAVDASRFLENAVGTETLGAAIFTIPLAAAPGPGRDGAMRGTVADSLFADNFCVDIRDAEAPGGPPNEMRYLDNRFFTVDPCDKVYGHNLVAPNGTDVPGLNALPQGDGNTRNFVRPAEGDLVLVPPAGAPGSRSPGLLAYGWSGNQARLEGPGLSALARAGQDLPQRFGVLEVAEPGVYSLIVDGQEVATATLAE
ncbi:MAG TPA: hypothetical protein VJG13_03560, partial [Thermoanaerobaculia bacterium]|nr:hypothetical protein [Thermoanaerobaculia bacterium]